MDMKGRFNINVNFPNKPQAEEITVEHADETFAFLKNGHQISIINNGDNSWSLVDGDLDQLSVNLIGTEIEKHYK